MGKEIRIFLSGIANSLNANGYYKIVTPPRKLGEITTKINIKRKKNQERINKVIDAKIKEHEA